MQTRSKGSRERYRATVEGVGFRLGWREKVEPMLLLRDIVTEQDGRTVTNHATFHIGKNLLIQGNLDAGDVIAFDATWAEREDDEHSCCVASWYTLSRPSKVVRVPRTPATEDGEKR